MGCDTKAGAKLRLRYFKLFAMSASAHVRLVFAKAVYDAFFAHHFMRNYRYCKN